MVSTFTNDVRFRLKRIFSKNKSLEEKLSVLFIIIGMILSFSAILVTILYSQPWWHFVIHLSIALLTLGVPLYSDNLEKNILVMLVIVGTLYFPFIYFMNAGNNGPGPIYFLLIIAYYAFYLQQKQLVITLTFFVVYYLSIITIGQFYPSLVVAYTDDSSKYIDLMVAIASVSLVIAIIANTTFRNYQKERRITEGLLKRLEEQNDMLTELSIKDQLTDVYNRRYLNQIITKELERYKEHSSPFHVMMIDLDWFKKVNDNFGHLFGDEVLRKVAQQINKATRDYDIIARYGGEEFCVIVSHLNPENCVTIAERIRLHVENLELRNNVKITVSIGVTSNCDEDTAKTLVKRADDLMYFAKANGKNCVEYKGCR